MVTVARKNKVALRTHFGSALHGVNPEDAAIYFFGNSTMTPLPHNKTCERKETTVQNLPSQILQAHSDGSECVVLTARLREFPPDENGTGDNLPYYRELFEANEVGRRQLYEKKWEPCDRDITRVAVHIRRGDLLSYLKKKRLGQTETTQIRLVHENVYVDILNQLMRKIEGFGQRNIEIRIFCEDMVPPSKIPSAVDWELVDLREQLSYNNSITQDIKIISGSNNSIEAFEEMCFSDVLITGASGFSHMVSILCKNPIVLGIPFWLSYDYVPNSLVSTATSICANASLQNAKSHLTCCWTSFRLFE